MSTQHLNRLDRYIRARYPIIGVLSHEETRVIASIAEIAARRSRALYVWSITAGITPNGEQATPFDAEATREIAAALETLTSYPTDAAPALFIFKDAHPYTAEPVITRLLRDVAAHFELSRHTLILLSPALKVPPELEKTLVLLDWPLPDTAELGQVLAQCERDLPERIPVTLNGGREDVINALRGLTQFEAASVLLAGITATGELGESIIPHIVQEKAQVIRKSGVLEFYDTSVTMGDIGGLEHLKQYAAETREAFSQEAGRRGVDAPRGVLLVGVPGTGKSLSAKAIAAGKMPLIRMDVGALIGGIQGESEGNMRNALRVAEAVAPCVVWIDEVEKALSGVESSGQTDGGVFARMFGNLLTWMQETTSPVYIVATANDARSLKPEFIRRFDDIFWVDLPAAADRRSILSIHLARRGCDLSAFPAEAVERIVTVTWGYTGAEIEKVVKAAIRRAFFQHEPLATGHLLDAARAVIPVSRTMAEPIRELRLWAAERAILAAAPLEAEPHKSAAVSRTADL